ECPESVFQMAKKKIKKKIKGVLEDFEPKSEEIETGNEHATSVRFGPPYEFHDPNYPDFMGFTTDDLDVFRVYLALWGTIEDSDLVYQAEKVTKRSDTTIP